MNLPSPDARPLLRIILGALVLSGLVFVGSIWAVVDAAWDNEVQPVEVNHAGSQRRLSERIAYLASELENHPDDGSIGVELGDVALRLRSIREGILTGDPSLDLDGEIPNAVRGLYLDGSPSLEQRMVAYEDAALSLAEGPTIDAAALAVIDGEAQGEVLIADLDAVVAGLDHALDSTGESIRTRVLVGCLVLGVLGVGTLVLVGFSLRQARRRLEEAEDLAEHLAESEEMYRCTMDALTDCVIIQDGEGRALRMNETARTTVGGIFGGVPQVGQHVGEWNPQVLDHDGTPLAPERRPVRRMLETGAPVSGQIICAEVGGERYWFECNASPIPSNRRGATAVLAFRDVSEERRLTAAVDAHARRFRFAVENAPIGMALLDADSVIVEANAALGELLAGEPASVIGRPIIELVHADVRAEVGEQLAALHLGEDHACRFETRLVDSRGRAVDVVLAVASIRDEAAGPTLIVQILDVRERARAEEAHRSALRRERDMVERLKALDQAKTDFVSTVSHELRTPLTSVLGYLEMLEDGTGGGLSPVQDKIVATMSSSGRNLLGLIEELLSILSLESGAKKQTVVELDLHALLVTVIERARPHADRSGVVLTDLIDPEIGTVEGDRQQLERVFDNLLSNAVKFTPEGGLVSVDVRFDAGTDRYSIEVVDTGLGIPENEQAQLFQKFFRSSTALRDAVPGTGLGLAITREIVAAHGGEISLSSVEGLGTTVHVELPRTAPIASSDSAAAPASVNVHQP